MGLKALRAQEMSRSVALPGFPRIQQAGSDEKKWKRGAILHWIQQGGVYGHSDGRSPEDGREQATEGRSVDLTGAQNASVRAQGGDQAPLAAIARVSAAKSETWILVLCLWM